VRVAAAEEGVDPRAEVTVLLVERAAMASLKEKWLGESGPTDVLAFPMDDQVPDDEPYILGDIVICPDVAREQALEAGDKVVEEVDLLLVHGFLHLMGYDHVKPQDARSMRHRERKILAEFNRKAAE
jgi:probable rRNA maturation factor